MYVPPAMRTSQTILACLLLVGLGTASDRTGACGASRSTSPGKAQRKMEVGSQVPDLKAVDHRGESLSLRGADTPVTLVYFYPKDNTPG